MWANGDALTAFPGTSYLPEILSELTRSQNAPLQFFDVNGPVARANRQRRPTCIHFPPHGGMAERAGNLNRNIQRDVPVAGMQIPAARDFRAAAHLRLDVSVTGLQRQRVEAAVNAQISVARVGVERAVEVMSFDVPIAGANSYIALDVSGRHVAVAGIELNFTGDSLGRDIAVTGAHVQSQLARHADFHPQGLMVSAEHRKAPVRHFHFDGNAVARLALDDLHVVRPDLPSGGGDMRVNALLVRAGDYDVAIPGHHVEFRAAGHLIGFRPLVRARRRSAGRYRDYRHSHCSKKNGQPVHESLRSTATAGLALCASACRRKFLPFEWAARRLCPH